METEIKDPQLWKIAKKRAGFKYHLAGYTIATIASWAIWYLNLNHSPVENAFPWPLWPMFFWGIGLFFSYLGAYKFNNGSAEREYQELLQKH